MLYALAHGYFCRGGRYLRFFHGKKADRRRHWQQPYQRPRQSIQDRPGKGGAIYRRSIHNVASKSAGGVGPDLTEHVTYTTAAIGHHFYRHRYSCGDHQSGQVIEFSRCGNTRTLVVVGGHFRTPRAMRQHDHGRTKKEYRQPEQEIVNVDITTGRKELVDPQQHDRCTNKQPGFTSSYRCTPAI